MPNNISARIPLIALAALVAGVTITAAFFEVLVFTDFASAVVILGLIGGSVLLVAAFVLMSNPQAGALLAMLGGLVTLLTGIVELAMLGLVWQSPPPWGTTQPAWLQETVYVVAGAVIGALALRVWHPREALPTAGHHPA